MLAESICQYNLGASMAVELNAGSIARQHPPPWLAAGRDLNIRHGSLREFRRAVEPEGREELLEGFLVHLYPHDAPPGLELAVRRPVHGLHDGHDVGRRDGCDDLAGRAWQPGTDVGGSQSMEGPPSPSLAPAGQGRAGVARKFMALYRRSPCSLREMVYPLQRASRRPL